MRGEGADLEPTNSKHSLSAAMSSEFLSSHFTFDEASSCCLNYKNSPMLVQREKREKKREREKAVVFHLTLLWSLYNKLYRKFFSDIAKPDAWKLGGRTFEALKMRLRVKNPGHKPSKRIWDSKVSFLAHENALFSGKFQTRLWRIHPGVENPKSNPWKRNWQSKIPRIFPQSRTMSWLMCERVPNDEQRSWVIFRIIET